MSKSKEIQGTKSVVIIIAIFVAVIIAGFAAYKFTMTEPVDPVTDVLAGNENASQYTYNDYVFYDDGFVWHTTLFYVPSNTKVPTEIDLITYYGPKEVEGIPIEGNLAVIDSVGTIQMTFPPELDSTVVLAGVELSKILSKKYNIYNKDIVNGVQEAYNGTYPVITCDNVTESAMVISLELGNETMIKEDNGCVTLTGTSSDELLKAADRLLFTLLHVMDD